MRDAVAVGVAVILHVPHMAEQMFAAGCGARILHGLHGKAGHAQAFEQPRKRLRIACRERFRLREPLPQMRLNHLPNRRQNRRDADGIRDNPIRAARDFAHQIGVSGGGHFGGRAAQHGDVRENRQRRGAFHRFLETVLRDGRAERRIAIHRRGRRNDHVAAAKLEHRPLDEIVNRPRPDRHRNHGSARLQRLAQGVNMAIFGMQRRRAGKNERRQRRNLRSVQRLLRVAAGGGERVVIRDNHRRFPCKIFLKHLRRVEPAAFADQKPFRVCGGLQCGGDGLALHNGISPCKLVKQAFPPVLGRQKYLSVSILLNLSGLRVKFVKNSERILGIHFFSHGAGGASVCDTRRRTFALIELDKNSQMV